MTVVAIVETVQQPRKDDGRKRVQHLCLIGVERGLLDQQVLSMNRIDDASSDDRARPEAGMTCIGIAKLRLACQKAALCVAKSAVP